MKKLALAALAAAALSGTLASTVDAAPSGTSCPAWACGSNGTHRTGVRTQDAATPVVSSVTLPSGETVILR